MAYGPALRVHPRPGSPSPSTAYGPALRVHPRPLRRKGSANGGRTRDLQDGKRRCRRGAVHQERRRRGVVPHEAGNCGPPTGATVAGCLHGLQDACSGEGRAARWQARSLDGRGRERDGNPDTPSTTRVTRGPGQEMSADRT